MRKNHFRSNYSDVNTQHAAPFDNSVCIPLTKGHHALIDAEDFELVSKNMWYAKSGDFRSVYAMANDGAGKFKSMPNVIMGKSPDGRAIDHINRNGADNRKANLRFAAHAENMRNCAPLNIINKSSQYKGVSLNKNSLIGNRIMKWKVRLRHDNKEMIIGHYRNEIEAAKAYDDAARLHHGEFAYLNFPALVTAPWEGMKS